MRGVLNVFNQLLHEAIVEQLGFQRNKAPVCYQLSYCQKLCISHLMSIRILNFSPVLFMLITHLNLLYI